MNYTIKDFRVDNEIIQVDVEYIYGDTTLNILVSSFMPQSKDDVIKDVENRAISEQTRLDQKALNENIIVDLMDIKNIAMEIKPIDLKVK